MVGLQAVAAAAVLCTALVQPGDAHALALGRLVVQSALGEPLRAEIDVPDINPDEAASLRVGVASGEAFRAAGMDFNPALGGLQISLQRRPDGRAYLRLTSPRAVTEPFVDLILEANWASGRIVRDYTLLFDPPNLRAVAPPAPLPPAVAPGLPAAPSPPVARPPVATLPPAVALAPMPARPPAASPPATPSGEITAQARVRVQAGDTAGRIAEANRTANVSLDQMLVAMLRSNPRAFIDSNVNRLKAGSVLDLPSEAEAVAMDPGEARQLIAAQSRDFNEYRRRLAGSAPGAAVTAADRQASGRVQAEVQESRPALPTQDKLTLSKGAAPAQTAAEAQIAQERQAREASTRVAELSRNIEELARLGTTPQVPSANAVPGAPAGTNAASTGLAPLTMPSTVVPSTSPTPVEAEAPAAAAPAPTEPDAAIEPVVPAATTEPAPAPAPVTAPGGLAPVEDASIVNTLRDNPLVLPGVVALLALLGGLGLYRLRQRKKPSTVDSSFLESRLQPDSFFGSSGGQRIDTTEASATGSSMVYSPSQLDAAGDVDPVAEADVYLAYGRDLQAEEILKEAMRSTPMRVAIHNKLLEIYAKRRDAKAFEVVATEAYGLTQGQGPEWEHACDLGRELDPSNPLYQPGGAPPLKAGAAAAVAGGAVNTVPFGNSTLDQPASDLGHHELDLDLDFSFDEPSAPAASQNTPIAGDAINVSSFDDLDDTDALTQEAASPAGPSSMSMDFDLDFPSESGALQAHEAAPRPLRAGDDAPVFHPDDELPDFDVSDEPPEPFSAGDNAALPKTTVQERFEPELMSFDLNDLNLDLGSDLPATDAADDALTFGEEGPLETKLSLAEEFRAIGDLEGARSLAEEVLAEASGTLKTKAGTFLADLS